MSHHEDAHGNDHGHDNTEGKRQYYPQGWYLPLVGLFVIAFVFALGAGSLLGISGTDKWGKSADEGHGAHQTEGTHDAHGDATNHDAVTAPAHNDSVNVAAPAIDSASAGDSAAKADAKPADTHAH